MNRLWVFFALCLVIGCRAAQLSGGGANVQIGPSAPVDYGYDPASCKPLGYIVGRGGGSFGGGWHSNDQLVEYAMNDLRNKAAELGGNFVQHESPQMGIAGDKNGVTTSTATVSGSAFLCTRKSGAGVAMTTKEKETSAPEPEAKRPAAPQPTGVAGFAFGMAATKASESCTAAGFEATPEPGRLLCTGTPESVGLPAEARVGFCNERVCRVEVASKLETSGRDTLAAVGRLHEQISKKYGEPAIVEQQLPGDCRKNAAPCLLDGSASLRYRWTFPKGASIELLTERAESGVRLLLRYEYDAPPAL